MTTIVTFGALMGATVIDREAAAPSH